MLHRDADDLGLGDSTQPGVNGKCSKQTGNAGARIAWCRDHTLAARTPFAIIHYFLLQVSHVLSLHSLLLSIVFLH